MRERGEPHHETLSSHSTSDASLTSNARAGGEAFSEWLTIDSVARIEKLLRACGVCTDDEQLTKISRAGDGNMNLTLRVRTSQQTVIVKQSRPWVEKYPDIAAPVERILQELRFYETASSVPQLAARMPRLLGSVPEQFLLVLECLGKSNDASALYHDAAAMTTFTELLPDLVGWLGVLHQVELPADQTDQFANRALRQLNHQHIFVIPFQDEPVLDLDSITPGLADLARPLAQNSSLRARLDELGRCYLADHPHLVHGDYFPGSWLICDGQLRIIDPEFSHGGKPEFDLGVLLAHGTLLGSEADESQLRGQIRALYPATTHTIDWRLVEEFAAVEVLRRLLGVAQLPLQLGLKQKARHIDAAVTQLLR